MTQCLAINLTTLRRYRLKKNRLLAKFADIYLTQRKWAHFSSCRQRLK
ncbi:hypothetical protein EHW99_2287 [Erwinia amylovora]|uniref:Uncharacterized protein n=2 Tax=Erwinia amylovora TaxID=552 RepID=A0A831A0I3_ERWAM|nr:hypothetical protein EaACW_1303 [Erwinia amylovora ACW56400]QJQ54989.1 hypothetical protein EHX00_2287 [Erwinia amylovora]CBA20243.1 hypothetical protein predicted by Glimmer/Critica [Erwinia amylovora CFBP1430]CCO78151.1 hypothetical protein BN432_1341 [Erwinia amylovora Ea356]CCO81936.1 hypothetical protein BN433_1352 [Erwinia amylovora Ea266]CCO85735.1 hypothetical protein BN434_1335 [Erwinia amylovora CFBP 2585]CCO89521.1 hypothetical protein BN435_1337 [Erwinia amylovora 01SFR-BO]CCO